jgi:hypothetical protein
MRNLIVAALMLLLAATTLFAQDALMKGAWDLGGSFSFTSSSGDLYENAAGDGLSSFGISPTLGYFFTDHLAVGALLSYTSLSQGDYSSSGFMFGPGLNYYLAQTGPGNPYGHLAYVIGSTSSGNGTTYKYSSSALKIGVGYLIWLNEHVGLDLNLGYSMDSSKETDPVEGDAVDGSAFGLGVGFKIFDY